MLYQDWDITLIGSKLRITPFTADDAEPYGRLMFGERYERFAALAGKEAFSLTGIEAILAHTANDEHHALRPPDGDTFIGWITLQKDEEGRPDIGISLIPPYQNRGFGLEAIRLFANRLHSVYGLEKVYVRISEGNPQSQKAFAKVGAVLNNLAPNSAFVELAEKLPDGVIDIPNLGYYYIPLPITSPAVPLSGGKTPEQKEREYGDSVPGEVPDYEPTYRDGSLKNECW